MDSVTKSEPKNKYYTNKLKGYTLLRYSQYSIYLYWYKFGIKLNILISQGYFNTKKDVEEPDGTDCVDELKRHVLLPPELKL